MDIINFFSLLCQEGRIQEMKILLKVNKNLFNAQDKNGWTALQMVSFHGHDLLAEELLQNGAVSSINKQEPWKGCTALMLAAKQGHKEVASVLLKHGATVNIRSKYGTSALVEASKCQQSKFNGKVVQKFSSLEDYKHIITLLFAHGAEISAQDRFVLVLHWNLHPDKAQLPDIISLILGKYHIKNSISLNLLENERSRGESRIEPTENEGGTLIIQSNEHTSEALISDLIPALRTSFRPSSKGQSQTQLISQLFTFSKIPSKNKRPKKYIRSAPNQATLLACLQCACFQNNRQKTELW